MVMIHYSPMVAQDQHKILEIPEGGLMLHLSKA